MPDQLDRASSFLDARHKARVSRTVTYRRGAGSAEQTVEVLATLGATAYEQDDGAGVIIKTQQRDYLIAAADLIFSGDEDPTLPERHDQIEDASETFEVMPVGTEPHYRFSDAYRRMLRIHTQEITVEL